jgi:hypothetical protein
VKQDLRIGFRVDGGFAAFPGLAKPVTIDCGALPPAQTAHLQQLVRQANFFALPSHQPSARGARDARAYTIEIDDGRQCKSVTVGEPIADAALRDLVDALCAHAAVVRSAR